MKKQLFIMGDSYSTFGGWIPEGYDAYYSEDRKDEPKIPKVEQTWWHILMEKKDYALAQNDSYSGSTVCNTLREGLPPESAFVVRMDRYLQEGFFEKNPVDLFLIFGATNDSWIGAPIGTVDDDPNDEAARKAVLPAFRYLLQRARVAMGQKPIMVILNSDLNGTMIEGMKTICRELAVPYTALLDIDKQNGHPTVQGMEQIARQVAERLDEIESGDLREA